MHLPVEDLDAGNLDGKRFSGIDFVAADDYSIPGIKGNKEQDSEDWGKKEGMSSFRLTYRV